MKVYYSYDETGVQKTDAKVYSFLRALKEGFKNHMRHLKDKIETENGFFIIKVEKDFNSYLEYYNFSKELENEMIPFIDSFNDDGHIVRIFQNLPPDT